MRYVSTRGEAPELDFEEVLLTGLARDGGLYVPEVWPGLPSANAAGFEGLAYHELAAHLASPFVGDAVDGEVLAAMTADVYGGFDDPAVAPLVEMGEGEWMLELFHGPTLAFKDFALQLLGRLFDYALSRRGERRMVVVATSGDTGSSAIEAFRGLETVHIAVLHPKGRVTEMQRRQMTTVDAANVTNLAVEGTFDDCQALVKAMFNDHEFRDRVRLSAVNSINWARVMAQSVYYVYARAALGAKLGDKAAGAVFSVPTGNFGDVYAGYVAARMGLDVGRLVVATNRNDILARVLADGAYRRGEVVATMSPSMDIQVASNFERLLFDICGRNGAAVRGLMAELAETGGFQLGDEALAEARALFTGERVDEEECLATMAGAHKDFGRFIDPHTAVGLAAGRRVAKRNGAPLVVLATAHAAKFGAAVERATGEAPPLPAKLAGLTGREEHVSRVENDLAQVMDLIGQLART